MAPRIARETRRVWSINVKREEGGFWLLNCKGGHQHNAWIRNGSWALVTEPSANPSFPAVPASVPWGSGGNGGYVDPGWGRDSELPCSDQSKTIRLRNAPIRPRR